MNAKSIEVNAKTRIRTLNVLDGVVLTEAIRYGISQAKKHLGISVSYAIYDLEDNKIPFRAYYPFPFFNAASSPQISPYLNFRKQKIVNPAPFVSAMPFSEIDEDFAIDSSNRRINFAAVPPSRLEVNALIDILSSLGWNFVTLIVSEKDIGQKKIQEFYAFSI